MSDVYQRLRSFLDQLPIGFPETESGVEIEILKRLFTEEEAEFAMLLTPFPEDASQIASRTDMDENELAEILESMSYKGLIFRIKREEKVRYCTAPYMIGLYEYSVKKMDADLAKLFKEYYDSAFQQEMGASNIPGFKVIPVEETIHPQMTLFPYHQLRESIRSSRIISVTDCICRKEARLLGKGCDHPLETCLSFGVAAEYYIDNGIGRQISPEEAIQILEEADKSGLVHAGANSKHLSNICNCCPCCCASLKGIIEKGHDKRKYMNALFEAIVDASSCTGCEECLDRCPVDAITVDDTAQVDREKCLGCGLCASNCPADAISLHLREDREEPFERVVDMGMAILEGKKKELGS